MVIQLARIKDSLINLLVLDPSSSHLAYIFITLNLDNKTANISKAGMVWTKASFNKAQRYIYMQKALEFLASQNVGQVWSEQYFSNPKMLTASVAVVPTINAFAHIAAYKNEAEYQEIGPTTWRSILGIKAIKVDNKRDYKTPTADLVIRQLGKLPESLPSNLDMRERNLPHDMTDALAIALAIAKYNDVTTVSLDKDCFRPLDLLEQLSNLSKDL